MAPNYFMAAHPDRLRHKRPQSLVTKQIVERAERICEQTRLTPQSLAQLAGIEWTFLRRLLRAELEPGEQMLRQLHQTLDAIDKTLLEQERRGEMCTACSKRGHWRPSCPEVAAAKRGRKGGR